LLVNERIPAVARRVGMAGYGRGPLPSSLTLTMLRRGQRAWAREDKVRLVDLATAVVALRQRAEGHGELHLGDPAFRAMVERVRVQLRKVGRGAWPHRYRMRRSAGR
jgi:hypothetical protein